jgi:hypothetical protein
VDPVVPPATRWVFGVAAAALVLASCRRGSTTEPAAQSARPVAAAPERPPPSATHARPSTCEPAPGAFDEEAILAEIDALQEALGYDDVLDPRHKPGPYEEKPKRKPRPDDRYRIPPPVALSEQEHRLCSLYLRYVDDGGSPDRGRELRFRHLTLLTHRLHLDEAIVAAASFVEDHPDDPLAPWAAEVVVDALAIQWTASESEEARERLLAWVTRLPTLPLWQHPNARRSRDSWLQLRVGLLVLRAKAARDAEPPDYEACARDYTAALEPNIGQQVDELRAGAAECLERAAQRRGRVRQTSLREP